MCFGEYLCGFLYGSFVDLRQIQWKMSLSFVELQTIFHVASICIRVDNLFYFLLQEILHQRFMAISVLWLAERQTDSDFKSETFYLVFEFQRKCLSPLQVVTRHHVKNFSVVDTIIYTSTLSIIYFFRFKSHIDLHVYNPLIWRETYLKKQFYISFQVFCL